MDTEWACHSSNTLIPFFLFWSTVGCSSILSQWLLKVHALEISYFVDATAVFLLSGQALKKTENYLETDIEMPKKG